MSTDNNSHLVREMVDFVRELDGAGAFEYSVEIMTAWSNALSSDIWRLVSVDIPDVESIEWGKYTLALECDGCAVLLTIVESSSDTDFLIGKLPNGESLNLDDLPKMVSVKDTDVYDTLEDFYLASVSDLYHIAAYTDVGETL